MSTFRPTVVLAAVAMLALTSQARAQQIDFHGVVGGCFFTGSGPCVPALAASVPSAGSGTGSLTWSSDTFTGSTNGAAVNRVSFGGGCPIFGSCGGFGNFTVLTPSSGFLAPTGLQFQLSFFFAPLLPGGTPLAGIPATSAVATATGMVRGDGSGTVTIDFPNDPTHFDFVFSDGNHTATCRGVSPVCLPGPWSGVAQIRLNDLDIGPNQTTPTTGNITVVSASPEPASLVLFMTGLVGLVPVVRYARRKAQG